MVKTPNYTKYLVVGSTPEEINASLKRIIHQYERDILFSNSFYGIINKNGFEAYKSSILFNTPLVKIIGKYEVRKDNTRIKMKITLSELVWVIFSLITLLLLSLFIITIIHADEFWLKITPLVMILISYLIIIIPFNLISKNAETTLKNQLNGVFEESD